MDQPHVPAPQGPRLALPAFVPDILARADRPLATILVAWLLTWGGSILLAALIHAVSPVVEGPQFEAEGFFSMFMLVVFAPVTETLIMAAIIWLLTRFLKPMAAIVGSALIWGAAHSAMAATWGLVIWWPFLIFSTLYVVWRQRSLAWALFMPFIVHAMQNSLPALALAFPDRFAGLM